MWFNNATKEKDINEYVLVKDDVNIFSDPKILDTMIYDKLQMKLWMIQNGKWKKESNFKTQNINKDILNRRSVFISPNK